MMSGRSVDGGSNISGEINKSGLSQEQTSVKGNNDLDMHKEFLEGCMNNDIDNPFEACPDETMMFSKIDNEDNTLTLLDDFVDDAELEDPFKYGTEEIMKDIMEDDMVRRSISKISNNKSLSFIDVFPS